MSIRSFILFSALILCTPAFASAAEPLPSLPVQSVLERPNFAPLFKSSTTTKPPRSLGKTVTSEFDDLTIKAPKGWIALEEYEEERDAYVTTLTDMRTEAAIFIYRSVTHELISILTPDQIGKIAEQSFKDAGCTMKGKGSVTTINKRKVWVIECESKTKAMRGKIYTFAVDDRLYMASMNASEKEWKRYKGILEKSIKTLMVVK